MLSEIEVSVADWQKYWEQIKAYRDKDLAHLEVRRVSMIPAMAIAINSTAFYFSVIQSERQRSGSAHPRVRNLYEIFDSTFKRFSQQADLAFGATGTVRKVLDS